MTDEEGIYITSFGLETYIYAKEKNRKKKKSLFRRVVTNSAAIMYYIVTMYHAILHPYKFFYS